VSIPKFDQDAQPGGAPHVMDKVNSKANFELPAPMFGSGEAEYALDEGSDDGDSDDEEDKFFEAESGREVCIISLAKLSHALIARWIDRPTPTTHIRARLRRRDPQCGIVQDR